MLRGSKAIFILFLLQYAGSSPKFYSKKSQISCYILTIFGTLHNFFTPAGETTKWVLAYFGNSTNVYDNSHLKGYDSSLSQRNISTHSGQLWMYHFLKFMIGWLSPYTSTMEKILYMLTQNVYLV